jgi:hypothetical protein
MRTEVQRVGTVSSLAANAMGVRIMLLCLVAYASRAHKYLVLAQFHPNAVAGRLCLQQITKASTPRGRDLK